MRKNSVVDFVLAKKIAAAVMIFCQAVFLLPKGAYALTSTSSASGGIVLSTVYVGAQAYGRIPLGVTSNASVAKVRFEIFDTASLRVKDLIATSTTASYHAYLLVDSLPAGPYSVRAVALNENLAVLYQTALQPMDIAKSTQAPVNPINTTAPDSATQTTATATEAVQPPVQTDPALSVWMLDAPTSTISQRSLYARTNIVADSVNFIIDGHNIHQTHPGIYSNLSTYNNYYFVWNAQNYSPDTYSIKVEATKNGQTVESAPIQIVKLAPLTAAIEPTATTTSQQPVATTTEPTVVTKIDIGSSAVNGVASGTVSLFAKATANISKINFFVEKIGGQELIGSAIYDSARGYWSYKWGTASLANGTYNVFALGYDVQNNKFYSNSTLKLYINNQAAIEKIISPTTSPKIIEVATTSATTEENSNVDQPKVATTTTVATALNPIKEIEPVKTIAVAPTSTSKVAAQPVIAQEKPLPSAVPPRQGNTSTTQVTVIDKPVIREPEAVASDECQQAGIFDAQRCELYRFSHVAVQSCQEAKLTAKEECISLIRSKFGEPAICQKISQERCDLLFSQVIVDKFIPQKQIDGASQALEGLMGKNIQFVSNQPSSDAASGEQEIFINEKNNFSQLEKSLESAILPVSPFAKSQEKINVTVLAVADEKDSTGSGVKAVLSIDSDGDGLSDDTEKRLGTDIGKGDSDGDGFSDGDEVKTGHNPLGKGMLAGKLQPVEQALLNKVTFEQPKTAGLANPEAMAVEKVEITTRASSSNTVKLTGKALPNQILSVFIYSALPIIVTVATDQNGNWSYELDKSLTNGKHEAYVVLNNEQGEIETKSAPFSFFVNEARAISQDDLLKADINVYNQTDTMLWWYATAGLILILFIAGLFFLYIRSKKTTSLG